MGIYPKSEDVKNLVIQETTVVVLLQETKVDKQTVLEECKVQWRIEEVEMVKNRGASGGICAHSGTIRS